MSKRQRRRVPSAAGAGAKRVVGSVRDEVIASAGTSAAEAPAAVRRGRPGRRTADERSEAVLQLLAGKATVDQLAAKFGVQAATIERWREIALESLAAAMRQGTAKSPHELELERDLANLREAFTDLAIRHELVTRALKERPSRPERSPR